VPTPQFILDLRARVGHEALWLPGVTAVVLDDDGQVLLVRRADNDLWTLVTGCLEPGEQPAAGAVREVEEETAVVAIAERVVSVAALPLTVYGNGDQVHWLDTTFRCRAMAGSARVNDDESVDVGWFTLDQLPESLPSRHRQCIRDAVGTDAAAKFELT
jgi:ADP-ribose pyrophosphatase YjhB (NUDIX family)